MKLLFAGILFARLLAPLSASILRIEENEHHGRNLGSCGKPYESCIPILSACCAGNTCHPNMRCYDHPRKKDQPCVPSIYPCADGLFCNPASFFCEKEGDKEGDPCSPFQSCGDELVCDTLYSVCARPSEEGENCRATLPCADGLFCHNSICILRGEEGESCIQDGEPCSSGLVCATTSSTCEVPAPEGSVCGIDADCEQALICDPETLACGPEDQVIKCNIVTGECNDGTDVLGNTNIDDNGEDSGTDGSAPDNGNGSGGDSGGDIDGGNTDGGNTDGGNTDEGDIDGGNTDGGDNGSDEGDTGTENNENNGGGKRVRKIPLTESKAQFKMAEGRGGAGGKFKERRLKGSKPKRKR